MRFGRPAAEIIRATCSGDSRNLPGPKRASTHKAKARRVLAEKDATIAGFGDASGGVTAGAAAGGDEERYFE